MNKINYYNSLINKVFEEYNIPSTPFNLYDPIIYTLKLSAKRIRPLLCLISCDALCNNIEKAKPALLALELFHNFTLLHDDIMDNADIRRGQPSVFKKWGRDVAILSGDALFAMAFKELSKLSPNHIKQVLEVFSNTAIQVCEGQQLDKDFETINNVSEEDYLEMIKLKTSVLIAASLKIGAIIGEANDELQNKFYNFGLKTGLAFQIKDDLLDAFGNESKFGKKNYGDILTNKKTYLYIIANKHANEEQKQQLQYLYSTNEINASLKINSILKIFEDLNIEALSQTKLQLYFDEAIEILNSMEINPQSKILIKEFSEKLLNREF